MSESGSIVFAICLPECWYLKRGENWSTRRKTCESKGENQQQTQPIDGIDLGHIGGRQVFSPLHHPCSLKVSILKN